MNLRIPATALAATAAFGMIGESHAQAAELLVNPGFEDTDSNGSTGDGWGSFGNAGFGAFGANGNASLFADQAANSGGVFQTGIAATPGTEYTFELTDVFIEDDYSADLAFGLEFFDADDATKIGEVIVQINDRDGGDPIVTGGGLQFDMSAVAPAGAAFVRPIITFGDVDPAFTGPASGRSAFVFDASLTVVPEPAAGAAIGVIGGMLAMRRR